MAETLVDSYSESNYIADTYSEAEHKGNSFYNTNQIDLSSCKFYIRKVGTPTGNVTAKLYAHSGTYGSSSVVTGSVLATSDNVDVTTISSAAFGLVTFTFSTPYNMAATTNYCIVVGISTGTAENGIRIGYDNTSPSHGGNYLTELGDYNNTRDMCFYVYGNATTTGTVVSVAAEATADGIAPLVTGKSNVTGVVGTSTADGVSPIVTGKSTIASVVAEATADAVSPNVTGKANVASVVAESTADAIEPVVAGKANVTGVTGTSTADGIAPIVTGFTETLIDSYPESNYTVDTYSAEEFKGNSFYNENRMDLSSCKFYIRKAGTPTGNVCAKLYAHDGTYGTSSVVTGTVLATSDNVDVTTLSSSAFELVTFNFSTPYTMAASNHYCMVVGISTGTAEDCIRIGYDNTTPTHGGNYLTESGDFNNTRDMIFYVYGTASTAGIVESVAAESTADGIAPVVSGKSNVSSVVAESTADGISPIITGKAMVESVVAESVADGIVPTVTGSESGSVLATVESVVAESAADGISPTVTGKANVTGVAGMSTANGISPVVSGKATIISVVAEATADGIAPIFYGYANGKMLAQPSRTIAATFVDGVATVELILNQLGNNLIRFSAEGVRRSQTIALNVIATTGTVVSVVAEATADGIAPNITGKANVTSVAATSIANAIAPTVTGGEVTGKALKQTLLNYGYPIAINDVWDVGQAAAIYADYDIVVFGDQYEHASHEAHTDTVNIITAVKVLNPSIEIFGYVPIGQINPATQLTMAQMKTYVDEWFTSGATGIFLDEYGFDYMVTRAWQNEIVAYIHGKGMNVIANSWESDYVFSKENMYLDWIDFHPNTGSIEPIVNSNDYSLFENMFYEFDVTQKVIVNTRLLDAVHYYQDVDSLYGTTYYARFGTKTMALDAIDKNYANKNKAFANGFFGSKILNIDAYCASPATWGADDTGYVHYNQGDYADLFETSKHTITVASYGGTANAKFTATVNGKAMELDWQPGATPSDPALGVHKVLIDSVEKTSV
jgi:hypothetical protein